MNAPKPTIDVEKRDGGKGEAAPIDLVGEAAGIGKTSDINLLRRAARERWPVPQEKRPMVVGKMLAIVEQESTTIPSPGGGEVEVSNARNQVAAARVLVAMEQQNQADEHLADKNDRLDAGKATERVVESIEVVTPMVRRIRSQVVDAARIADNSEGA